MDDTSVSLLERIAARNLDEDWQRLLTIYQPFIEVQVRRYPQLAEEVDDVVQNICMVLVRELPEFQRQRTGSFRKWLRLVTVNQLRITARKLKNRPRPESDIGALELGHRDRQT
jgi:RNA polymerase sigma-70 factor (ECF subfamily)